ncbi:hypothetical protein BHE97_05590 [Aeromicrobium sp. PE09-221]|uniref:DUF6318 family protein n=1 Tax=Aeromicrobium sp. PE09-221 TaxID=1898043 RepID=UPI000B3EA0EE|nr:DUF6318 family protein [Aeromicrobium sp. PE09-221]OUZ11307.1 hypothetical protein BHE97_05590 [Aeromicrobium sp. PE09-221]
MRPDDTARGTDSSFARRRGGLGVAAVLLAVSLAACSDGEGSDLPEASAESTPVQEQDWEWSATEVPPAPDSMEDSEQSAEEFAQYAMELIFYAYATGDAGPVLDIADESTCEGCASLQRFASAESKKLQIAGSEPTFTFTDLQVNDDVYYNFSVAMDIPEGQRVNSADPEDVQPLPAADGVPASLNLQWTGEEWLLLNFDLGE